MGIVLELQREALDRSTPLADLLRKAIVVARKLKIAEFGRWAAAELSGYEDPGSVPDYRRVTGTVSAFNPYNNPCALPPACTLHSEGSVACRFVSTNSPGSPPRS